MPELKTSQGFRYLKETAFDRVGIRSRSRPEIRLAEPFKRYPDAARLRLPQDCSPPPADFWQTLAGRRSERRYGTASLGLADLALLLWASQGITARAGPLLLRTAPSAGALYPIETYLSVQAVAGVEAGLYHFAVADFELERLSEGPVGEAVARAALDQRFLARAAAVFVWTAVMRRTMAKYGHRGLRYVLLDAGHVGQNLVLAAEALGLAACPVAAFYDEELNRLLEVDGDEESVVYLAAVGAKS